MTTTAALQHPSVRICRRVSARNGSQFRFPNDGQIALRIRLNPGIQFSFEGFSQRFGLRIDRRDSAEGLVLLGHGSESLVGDSAA